MPPTIRRLARLLAVLFAIGLIGAACGGKDNNDASGDSSSTTTEAAAKLSGTLNASGSTFQQAYEEACIEQFKEDQPGVTVNYGGGGSGKGKQDLADGVVDFA